MLKIFTSCRSEYIGHAQNDKHITQIYTTKWLGKMCVFFFAQLFELGPDGGDHETDGDLLAETDVLAYDCAAR